MDGILVCDKPQNMTSHDVVNIVRRATGVRKVGHTGTLDPMATGVLPIFVGKATRLIEYATKPDDDEAKAYSATLRIGISTDTADIWGNLVAADDAPMAGDDSIREVISSFVGEQMQIPPMYSAIKLNGKKLYEYARAGEQPAEAIKSRRIKIASIDIVFIDRVQKEIGIDVACTKGTYIRTLCADIGTALGTFATMTALRRTRSDGFVIDGSIPVDVLKEKWEPVLRPMDEAISYMDRIDLPANEAAMFSDGMRITAAASGDGPVSVYARNEFLGIAKRIGNVIKPEKVIRK